jgi:hypothetical protein
LSKGEEEAGRRPVFFVKGKDERAPRSSLPRRRESRIARKDWIPAFAGMTFQATASSPFQADSLSEEMSDALGGLIGDFRAESKEFLVSESFVLDFDPDDPFFAVLVGFRHFL